MKKMYGNQMVRAKQLVQCNVVDVFDNNTIGIRNTMAIKFHNNGYDLIKRKWIPFMKKQKKGICLVVLNTPFKNSNALISVAELDVILEEYRHGNKALKLYDIDFIPNIDMQEKGKTLNKDRINFKK